MNRFVSLEKVGIVMFLLVACNPISATPSETSDSGALRLSWEQPASFPLSEPGPYDIGKRNFPIVDESRNGREIRVEVWYPAIRQTDANGQVITNDALPDISEAPYPLILTGPDTGFDLFEPHLISHGYVMAIVYTPVTSIGRWDYDMVDNARDLIFVLDQVATKPPEGLEGVIDTNHVGVAGYSGEGNISFAVSGARVDPEFYLSQCEKVPDLYPTIFYFWMDYACSLTENWDEFALSTGNEVVGDDGLWPAITDERIRVIVSMAAPSPWLYGERGLATVDRPVLIVSPTKDEDGPHEMVTDIYEQIGNPKKVMISFIDRGHMMVSTPRDAKTLNHFATAFLGYYLQGRDDYAEYFSEDFVAQFDDLAWGVYEK